jgi:hypothetical protein
VIISETDSDKAYEQLIEASHNILLVVHGEASSSSKAEKIHDARGHIREPWRNVVLLENKQCFEKLLKEASVDDPSNLDVFVAVYKHKVDDGTTYETGPIDYLLIGDGDEEVSPQSLRAAFARVEAKVQTSQTKS